MTGEKAQRRAARERVATYHEQSLIELVSRLAETQDSYRAGDIDVHRADETIHQYHRAARELWKFCLGENDNPEFVAKLLDDPTPPINWWEQGAPRDHR